MAVVKSLILSGTDAPRRRFVETSDFSPKNTLTFTLCTVWPLQSRGSDLLAGELEHIVGIAAFVFTRNFSMGISILLLARSTDLYRQTRRRGGAFREPAGVT